MSLALFEWGTMLDEQSFNAPPVTLDQQPLQEGHPRSPTHSIYCELCQPRSFLITLVEVCADEVGALGPPRLAALCLSVPYTIEFRCAESPGSL